jgi:hypothetical protein
MVTFPSGLRNPEAWPGNPRVEHSGVARVWLAGDRASRYQIIFIVLFHMA